MEGNTWEYAENVDNAPEKVADFYKENPAAPRCIRAMAFGTIPFRPISFTSASGRCLPGGGVIVRGTAPASRVSFRSRPASCLSVPLLFTFRLFIFICTALARHVIPCIYYFWYPLLYLRTSVYIARTCRWILILSSLDPLPGAYSLV